jgi:hypothetical protein
MAAAANIIAAAKSSRIVMFHTIHQEGTQSKEPADDLSTVTVGAQRRIRVGSGATIPALSTVGPLFLEQRESCCTAASSRFAPHPDSCNAAKSGSSASRLRAVVRSRAKV